MVEYVGCVSFVLHDLEDLGSVFPYFGEVEGSEVLEEGVVLEILSECKWTLSMLK